MGALIGQMQGETRLLMGVMDDIQNARLAMLPNNQDQVREILAGALGKLEGIGRSRTGLEQQLAQAMAPPPGQGPGGPGQPGEGGPGRGRGRGPGRGPGLGPLMGPGMGLPMPPGMDWRALLSPERIHDVLGRAVDEARALPAEEYERERERLLERLIAAILQPPQPGQGPPGGLGQSGPPPLDVPAAEPTDPQQREQLEAAVRNRLRLLQQPWTALDQHGVDLTRVEEFVLAARDAVNAGRLIEAAQATNQATDALWQLAQTQGLDLNRLLAPPPAEGPPGGGDS
jgi:hypothetical protein